MGEIPRAGTGAQTPLRRNFRAPPCQDIVWEGKDVDLGRLPIQMCWPGDGGLLMAWGLTVTRGPHKTPTESRYLPATGDRTQQGGLRAGSPIAAARWVSTKKSGAALSAGSCAGSGPGTDTRRGDAGARQPERMPVCRAAQKPEIVKCLKPIIYRFRQAAENRIGRLYYFFSGQTALEGPFGDHTGYYNEQEASPVFTVERITTRRHAELLLGSSGGLPV